MLWRGSYCKESSVGKVLINPISFLLSQQFYNNTCPCHWQRVESLWLPWITEMTYQWVLDQIKTEVSLELNWVLLDFGCIMRKQDSMEKNNNARKRWQQEDKRKVQHELDWLKEGSHGLQFTRAKQLCLLYGVWSSLIHRVRKQLGGTRIDIERTAWRMSLLPLQ